MKYPLKHLRAPPISAVRTLYTWRLSKSDRRIFI